MNVDTLMVAEFLGQFSKRDQALILSLFQDVEKKIETVVTKQKTVINEKIFATESKINDLDKKESALLNCLVEQRNWYSLIKKAKDSWRRIRLSKTQTALKFQKNQLSKLQEKTVSLLDVQAEVASELRAHRKAVFDKSLEKILGITFGYHQGTSCNSRGHIIDDNAWSYSNYLSAYKFFNNGFIIVFVESWDSSGSGYDFYCVDLDNQTANKFGGARKNWSFGFTKTGAYYSRSCEDRYYNLDEDTGKITEDYTNRAIHITPKDVWNPPPII